MAVKEASRKGINNFSILSSHVLVPPAMEAILSSPTNRIQGFLAAGHVCTVMGTREYESLARKYKVPIVVTGFEPVDILQGIRLCITMLEQGTPGVENAYSRSVRPEGNKEAQRLLEEIYRPVDRKWRGIGKIPSSGLGLTESYQNFDAISKFGLESRESREPEICQAGKVLTGLILPTECEAFGTLCTPEKPLGAPMVSTEGACAAYYRYKK
jgi:hydrogenase expression/formation protein HypD